MRNRYALILAVWLTLFPWIGLPALAGITGSTSIGWVDGAVYATHAPGDTDRLFVVDRDGTIQIIDLTTQQTLGTPFLSLSDVDSQQEGGLLGLAFHPDYQTNGKFYTYSTVDNGGVIVNGAISPFSSHIREYTVSANNPNVANLASQTEVMSWAQPYTNHNGGWIGFSPHDGYLYITSGDGGASQPAQDLNTRLGKILRIDVNGDDYPTDANENFAIPADNPFVGSSGADEIWAYGLRNPWRASFDRQTGDFWIADVGESAREEVNFQSASSPGGENYGWDRREGTIAHQGGTLLPTDTDPVHDYPRTDGVSITGGIVYRGPDPTRRGEYFFADAFVDNVWTLDPSDGYSRERINPLLSYEGGSRVGFGEDADGNLYILHLYGDVRRIDTHIMLTGDFNGDEVVQGADLTAWLNAYGTAGSNAADANGDGLVNGSDYAAWRENLGRSLPSPSTGGGGGGFAPATPEPTTLLLLLAGSAGAGAVRTRRS